MKLKPALHTQILIGMLIGIVAGIIVRNLGLEPGTISNIIAWVKPVGDIFLRLIFMMIIPLILCALTLGVAGIGDMSKLGRIGWKMFKYTIVVTSISVLLGVTLVQLIQPGKGLNDKERAGLLAHFRDKNPSAKQGENLAKNKNAGEIITQIVPKNPLEDMVRAFDPDYTGGGLISVMVFALIMGIAMMRSDKEKIAPFKAFLEGLYEVVMKVISFGLMLAPLGVASLLFVLTVSLGFSVLDILLKYIAVVLFALAFHQFITYSIILKYFSNTSPVWFFRNIQEVMVTAFSTSSSNASLPVAIKVTTENLKFPKDITNFILTIGSTANQNGTALYEGVTILFLAQCFGVHLDIAKQVIVVFTCIIAGMGSAGVPGGSLPVMMLILMSLGIPGESIFLIYGVERILDMCRTVLNVTGDITAVAYISNQEKKRSEKLLNKG
jgi:DAACS family dicarboxylate/amino acid:cation (Na+ or H+) symporter